MEIIIIRSTVRLHRQALASFVDHGRLLSEFDYYGKNTKHTTGGIPRWSPTLVLVARFSAYVWQSGRDAQFSLTYGRMCNEVRLSKIYSLCKKELDKSE